jgi:phage baseplate assembly protein W
VTDGDRLFSKKGNTKACLIALTPVRFIQLDESIDMNNNERIANEIAGDIAGRSLQRSNDKCYQIPLCFGMDDFPTCSELESIDQNIGLILTTCPGEHKFNSEFGCGIWEMDFERVVSRKRWEDRFTGHILQAVHRFEKRLKNLTVAIHVMETVREDLVTHTTAIKEKVSVQINGKLVSNDTNCGFSYVLFLGPLTTE